MTEEERAAWKAGAMVTNYCRRCQELEAENRALKDQVYAIDPARRLKDQEYVDWMEKRIAALVDRLSKQGGRTCS
jgi:hypothetical protein